MQIGLFENISISGLDHQANTMNRRFEHIVYSALDIEYFSPGILGRLRRGGE
jgi:hypothetical protein